MLATFVYSQKPLSLHKWPTNEKHLALWKFDSELSPVQMHCTECRIRWSTCTVNIVQNPVNELGLEV